MAKKTCRILVLVLLASFAVRLLCVHFLGVRHGGDSRVYLNYAQQLAEGDFSTFSTLPLNFTYPAAIAVVSLFVPINDTTLVSINLIVSCLTVFLIWRITACFASERTALLAALLAAFYPILLFWSVYVLTETLFFFLLSLFTLSVLFVYIKGFPLRHLGVVLAIAPVIIVSRPPAFVAVVVAFCWLLYHLLRRRFAARTTVLAILAVSLVLAVVVISVLISSPVLRDHVVSQRHVSWLLWSSTTVRSSSPSQTTQSLQAGRVLTAVQRSQAAMDFIRENPVQYLAMACERFTSFWYPWIFSEHWSLRHRVFDAVLSLAMTSLAAWGYVSGRRFSARKSLLLALALSFSVLPALSLIDSDARYRVPAELLMIPLAALGLSRIPFVDRFLERYAIAER